MKTNVIVVSSKGKQMETALAEAEKMAAYQGLSARNKLHLRLLTEEMMGLMRSITGDTEGEFWIENEDGEYALHLLTETRMTSVKREKLLSTATSGKNESAKGLMGRLRDLFDRAADEDVAGFSSPLMLPDYPEFSTGSGLDWEWSMVQYEEDLMPYVQRREDRALEAWDELEKSVVAKVADDVKVAIRGGTVELTIIKKMK